MHRKSENPWFEILYSVVVPSASAEKSLNMDAQLQTILYIKPTKLLKIARLNSVSVITNGDTVMCFLALPARTLQIFVAPYNELAKHFYTVAHLQW